MKRLKVFLRFNIYAILNYVNNSKTVKNAFLIDNYLKIMKCKLLGLYSKLSKVSWWTIKLDSVGPLITDPPPTSSTTLSPWFFFFLLMWHVSCDTWHMTGDTWHMTGWGRLTFFKNFSSLALTVWEWRCTKDISTKDDFISQSVKYWETKVFVHRVC